MKINTMTKDKGIKIPRTNESDAGVLLGIKIRMADISDAKVLLEIYKPYVINTAITFEYEVPPLEEFENRIQKTLKQYPYLVACVQNEIVGYTYVSPFKERSAYDWAVETSVYIRQDMKRMGIGKRLYDALEAILKRQNILNMNACIAYPAEEDRHLTTDSVKFHETMGFKMCGRFHQCGYKFHRWYDMVWMEKMIGEHRAKQPEVIPVHKINVEEILIEIDKDGIKERGHQ